MPEVLRDVLLSFFPFVLLLVAAVVVWRLYSSGVLTRSWQPWAEASPRERRRRVGEVALILLVFSVPVFIVFLLGSLL